MQLNKQEHFPVRMYSHSMRGTKVAATEAWWLLSRLPECSAPKTPDDSLKACACSPYIPPTLCISITFVMSLNDIAIVCFPLPAGKCCICTGEPCQLVCAPAGVRPICFSTATHGPSHQFHIPNFKPVTLSPRYFGVPLYWSLKFIKITH